MLGASAGISGLLGYYMVRFPKRQISYLAIFLIAYIGWVHIPAFFAFLIKFGWEFFFVSSSLAKGSNVAHWAHLGGFAFGFLYAKLQEVEKLPPKEAK